MRLFLTIKGGVDPVNLIRRIKMLEGVSGVVEDEPMGQNHSADLAVWLDHDGSACDIEDLLHGTKGVRKVSILR